MPSMCAAARASLWSVSQPGWCASRPHGCAGFLRLNRTGRDGASRLSVPPNARATVQSPATSRLFLAEPRLIRAETSTRYCDGTMTVCAVAAANGAAAAAAAGTGEAGCRGFGRKGDGVPSPKSGGAIGAIGGW